MNPATNSPRLMRRDSESPEDEDSHSTSPVDVTSTDEFDELGSYTKRVLDLSWRIMSTMSMPPGNSTAPVDEMPLVHHMPYTLPMPQVHQMPHVHSMPLVHTAPIVQSMPLVDGMPFVHPMPHVQRMPYIHPTPPVPSTSRGIEENNDDYRFEAVRLSSFQSWPKSFIDPASLAAAGFYYTGHTDIVRCFECQLVVNLWTDGDIPMQIHEMRSAKCRFIRNEHCNNVPIGTTPDKVLRTKRRNRDISCPYGLQYKESFDSNDHGVLRHIRNPKEAPKEMTDENPERSNTENDSNEITLREKVACLEEENRLLKDARSCKFCREREATIIFLPCGHVATCQDCSSVFKKCIICRQNIEATTRIFLA